MAGRDDGAPKPSSSVKLVLLGEAAVGKVRLFSVPRTINVIPRRVTCSDFDRPGALP